MPHLNHEALARLVDEPATSHEAAHLAACETCRAELDTMREDVQALALLPDVTPAPDAWDALERRLVDEGLLRRRRYAFAAGHYARLAAAIVLFVAGTAAGRLTAGPGTGQYAVAPQPVPPAAAGAALPAPPATAFAAGGSDVSQSGQQPPSVMQQPPSVVQQPQQQQPRQSPVSFAATGSVQQPRTLDEAAALLRQTEEWYLTALTRYAELTTQADVNDPIARLAALQSIVLTTQAALSQTPSDPVINGAHLTAVAQRDAALRQVASTTGERWH
jgi:hypothetical protein